MSLDTDSSENWWSSFWNGNDTSTTTPITGDSTVDPSSSATTGTDSSWWGQVLSSGSNLIGQLFTVKSSSQTNATAVTTGSSAGDATVNGAFNGLLGWFESTTLGQTLVNNAVSNATDNGILSVVKSPIFWILTILGVVTLIYFAVKKK